MSAEAKLVRDHFLAAVELPAAERSAYLTARCGADPELRAAVERLLAAHNRPAAILNQPAAGAIEQTQAFLPGERPGAVIAGRYKLLEAIGEGGMGTVWVAEQTQPVRRKTALKLIKAGMDTKEVIARFEQERQALAMMDHPNIAKVLDAGTTEQGRPFFAMELVRGVKITDYCDDRQLSTEERIKLFVMVCQAVQHAHQKGIIHRDLKPSNILVTVNDGLAVPKVIDFGVAKATLGRLTEQTVYTQFHQMVGTPLYMSPEQADMTSLDVDTRSDIYALGVLLYELLTGRTPIDAMSIRQAGLEEMRRIIREVDPPRPSQRLKTLAGDALSTTAKHRRIEAAKLSGVLRGDLDWIVMKCLEKDRNRRYDTANSLALDLQRHLHDEVITARPPTAGYLLGKLIRRNKLTFAAGAAIAASLVVGIAASAWHAVRATRAEKVAVSEATRATAAFDELRATAPAFAEQARALAARERFDDAIAKLDYAVKLRPDAAEYLLAKADLLQCRLRLAEAAVVYRQALLVQPGLARAETSAALCDDLLASSANADGKLTREGLAKLHVAMQKQQRPTAELMPVARLLGEEKKLLLDYWLARLKDLPVSAERALKDRLTMREDGRLALDLGRTKVTDLSPLAGAPLATLNLNGAAELTDLSPLAGLTLIELGLEETLVADLTPLREMHSLERLSADESQVADLAPLAALRLKRLGLSETPVTDLTPIRDMPLESLNLRGTRVTDLSPLIDMPLKTLFLDGTPVRDFSPLASMPLEKCYLGYTEIADLAVLRGRPLKELSLAGCAKARRYGVLTEIPTLESLLLPETFRSLPDDDLAAIGALRGHPKLRQIQADATEDLYFAAVQSKDIFWHDWDRLQTFLPALRKAGFQLTRPLIKLPDGNYFLNIQLQPLSDLSIFQGAPIGKLVASTCKITDLTPLRDLPLTYLNVSYNPFTDIDPLRGMQLEELHLVGAKISDLSPLKGMPLQTLLLAHCSNVTDISPLLEIPTLENLMVPATARNVELLRKMPNLKTLDFTHVGNYRYSTVASTVEDFWQRWDSMAWKRALDAAGIVYSAFELVAETAEGAKPTGLWTVRIVSREFSDCSVFKGADNIRELNLAGSTVADLQPLRELKLTALILPPNVLNQDIEFLRTHSQLQRISFKEDRKTRRPAQTAAEFWKEYENRAWLRLLRNSGLAIKSAEQLPDGTWDVNLDNSAIRDLTLLRGARIGALSLNTTAVADLTPLRDQPLRRLNLSNTSVTDLSPLKGLPIAQLVLRGTRVTDLSALRGMPLAELFLANCRELTDLSPLADCRELKTITLPPKATNIEFLRRLPKLERISFQETPNHFVRPTRTAEEFWKEYDATKK